MFSSFTRSGVNVTTLRSRGPSETGCANVMSSIVPRTVADTGAAVAFQTSVLTVSVARSSVSTFNAGTTYAFRSATGPLSIRYTGPQRPMFLSAGVGFQSTHIIDRS